MSLHVAAQHLASKGRDGDSTLVHMSPGEVKGLQALAMAHGGSLSINPDTGLVEASFLKRILPMVAGAGLMMIPGVGPLAAAGMVGGFETMRTGDIGKGLMAGLGAYGGAGLAGSLSNAAASTAVDASAQNLANQAIAEGSTTAGMAEATRNTATPTLSSIGEGFSQVTKSPEALGQFGKQNLMNIGAAAAPALNDAMTPKAPEVPGVAEEDPMYAGAPYKYRLSPNFSGFTPRQPQPYYRPTGLGYAEGGNVMLAAGGSYDDEPMGDDVGMASGGIAAYAEGGLPMKKMSLGDGIYRDTDDDTASLGAYEAALKRMEKQYGAANLKAQAMPKSGIARLGQMKAMASGGLGSYSDGGRMLKGPGDGMSDDIPAVIGNKQPARLADGEFVVPADVVSHLGNGSTDAGAKKLYSMMDKIRTARTGKKKQAPAVKGDKYLPKFADGGDVSSTAEASAPAFSYPGSGMSLADITSLGNLIARGDSGLAQAPIQAPIQAPMQGFTNADLAARLAMARANRPTVAPVMLPAQPKTDTQASGLSRFFRGLTFNQGPAEYDPFAPGVMGGS
jgi:hypothetical protein